LLAEVRLGTGHLAFAAVDDDRFLFETADEALAQDLMRERHWVEGDEHFTVTEVLLMADTPGRDPPMWSVRGHPERYEEECPLGGGAA
jgi:hypothetical protein